MRYELISFDLDGTLVDTASEIAEAANRALDSHGIERRPVAEITLLIGAGPRAILRHFIRLNQQQTDGLHHSGQRRCEQQYANYSPQRDHFTSRAWPAATVVLSIPAACFAAT